MYNIFIGLKKLPDYKNLSLTVSYIFLLIATAVKARFVNPKKEQRKYLINITSFIT